MGQLNGDFPSRFVRPGVDISQELSLTTLRGLFRDLLGLTDIAPA